MRHQSNILGRSFRLVLPPSGTNAYRYVASYRTAQVGLQFYLLPLGWRYVYASINQLVVKNHFESGFTVSPVLYVPLQYALFPGLKVERPTTVLRVATCTRSSTVLATSLVYSGQKLMIIGQPHHAHWIDSEVKVELNSEYQHDDSICLADDWLLSTCFSLARQHAIMA